MAWKLHKGFDGNFTFFFPPSFGRCSMKLVWMLPHRLELVFNNLCTPIICLNAFCSI